MFSVRIIFGNMRLQSRMQSAEDEKFYRFSYRFEPPKIEYDTTKEKHTGEAGMGNIVDLFTQSRQYGELRMVLPVRRSNYAYDSVQYALSLLVGIWLGAECLEDVEKYKRDPLLLKKLGTSHPQTGVKIEGVGWNYKHEWALDSLSCFDDVTPPLRMQVITKPLSTSAKFQAKLRPPAFRVGFSKK